jgi:hypothetical protein
MRCESPGQVVVVLTPEEAMRTLSALRLWHHAIGCTNTRLVSDRYNYEINLGIDAQTKIEEALEDVH